MKPYYADDYCTIYHGDCREILPSVQADVVVTDPPYGIADAPIKGRADMRGRRVGTRPNGEPVRPGKANTWHPPSTWDRELEPGWLPLALTAAPVVALFGHWRKRGEFEAAAGICARVEIVWAKDTHVGPPCPLAMRDERIWIFSQHAVKPTRFETTVWDEPIIPTWGHRWHKNEKPLQLMTRLVSLFPADTVLDPFMGSGTTLRAAKDLGRKAIRIEIEERYCEIAARRLSQEVLPFGASA